MASPTVIRSKVIESDLHQVVSYFDTNAGFSVATQHYLLNDNGTTILIKESLWTTEALAIDEFINQVRFTCELAEA